MQMDEAAYLRRQKRDTPCDHPHAEREYYLGSHTGDDVCTTCGQAFAMGEWHDLQKSRAASAEPSGEKEDRAKAAT